MWYTNHAGTEDLGITWHTHHDHMTHKPCSESEDWWYKPYCRAIETDRDRQRENTPYEQWVGRGFGSSQLRGVSGWTCVAQPERARPDSRPFWSAAAVCLSKTPPKLTVCECERIDCLKTLFSYFFCFNFRLWDFNGWWQCQILV